MSQGGGATPGNVAPGGAEAKGGGEGAAGAPGHDPCWIPHTAGTLPGNGTVLPLTGTVEDGELTGKEHGQCR